MSKKTIDPRELKDQKQRKCLGIDCGRLFTSLWRGNRLCEKCKEKVNYIGISLADNPVSSHTKKDG